MKNLFLQRESEKAQGYDFKIKDATTSKVRLSVCAGCEIGGDIYHRVTQLLRERVLDLHRGVFWCSVLQLRE